MRRDPGSGLVPPVLSAVKWLVIPTALTFAAVEIGFLQRWLGTTSLDGNDWRICLGLGLVVAVVVELDKWIRRRRAAIAGAATTRHAR